jgi:hypothetical protein
MPKRKARVWGWLREHVVWVLLTVVAVLLLTLASIGILGITETLTAFSSVAIAIFTVVLVDLTREANVFTLWSQKHALNPTLRVHVRKGWRVVQSQTVSVVDNKRSTVTSRHLTRWQAELILWNTGSGTILVTDWSVDDRVAEMNLRVWLLPDREAAEPPLLIPPLETVSLDFWVTCEGDATVVFEYATAEEDKRFEEVPIGTR